MPRTGRPTKLTPERALGIIELVRAGNYKKTAALANGVSESALYEWIERGEQDRQTGKDTIFADFAESLTRAESESETALLSSVIAAIPDDPKLALEILARRYPARWARTNRPEGADETVDADVVDVIGLTDEALAEIAHAAGLVDEHAQSRQD